MAAPETIKFGKFLVLLGNGASPEDFVAPCGLTSKGFNRSATTRETDSPDCDDPDLPAWTERDVRAKSAVISGSGVVDKNDYPMWEAFFGTTKNVRIKEDVSNGLQWTGRYVCTKLDLTVQLGEKVQFSVELQSDGEITSITLPT